MQTGCWKEVCFCFCLYIVFLTLFHTVHHLDVRTQAMYQLMDKDFVGLIISCFNENTSVCSASSKRLKSEQKKLKVFMWITCESEQLKRTHRN